VNQYVNLQYVTYETVIRLQKPKTIAANNRFIKLKINYVNL